MQFKSSYKTLFEGSNCRLFDSKGSLTFPTGTLDVFNKDTNTVISLEQFTFEHCWHSMYSIKHTNRFSGMQKCKGLQNKKFVTNKTKKRGVIKESNLFTMLGRYIQYDTCHKLCASAPGMRLAFCLKGLDNDKIIKSLTFRATHLIEI